MMFGDFPLHLRTGLKGQVPWLRLRGRVQQARGPRNEGARWGLWVAGAVAPAFEASESWGSLPQAETAWGLLQVLRTDSELYGLGAQVPSNTDKTCYLSCK